MSELLELGLNPDLCGCGVYAGPSPPNGLTLTCPWTAQSVEGIVWQPMDMQIHPLKSQAPLCLTGGYFIT